MGLSANARRVVYAMLIVTSVGVMTGRILAVRSKPGGTPMLSANDRSRWAAVRALGDQGTYVIDDVIEEQVPGADGKPRTEWQTIDKVRHRGHDGKEHYYSSKPPLLITLLAGEYWLVKQVTGATLGREPFYTMRLMLILTNVLPLIVYFVLLAVVVEQLGSSGWGRVFVMAAACWGTFLTTFAVTINNHLPAAISVLIALCAALPVVRRDHQRPEYLAIAGFFAAFAVTNELPALSFLVLLGAVLLWYAPRQTLLAFVPAAAVVAALFFATNLLAHGSWRPPYAHRQDGPMVARLPLSEGKAIREQQLSERLRSAFDTAGIPVSEQAVLRGTHLPQRWVLWDRQGHRRYAILERDHGFEVRTWDNWYEYPGSYWLPENTRGVDRGEASRGVYAFHVLIGHRGILSLTPIWLLSLLGIAIWLARGDATRRGLALMVFTLTVICLAFYLLRPLVDRNYGGVSCGFRWMFWFIPLWLVCALPAADWCAAGRIRRWAAWLLLLVSVISASYASLNPWSHSWLFDYWTYLGWLQY